MTRKTGNFKRFGVFVKMLVSALESSSDAVHLDLLTYADLVSQRWRAWGLFRLGSVHALSLGLTNATVAVATAVAVATD